MYAVELTRKILELGIDHSKEKLDLLHRLRANLLRMAFDSDLISIYRNKKKDAYYLFIGSGTDCTNSNSDNNVSYVMYQSLAGEMKFVREEKEFYEKFELVLEI